MRTFPLEDGSCPVMMCSSVRQSSRVSPRTKMPPSGMVPEQFRRWPHSSGSDTSSNVILPSPVTHLVSSKARPEVLTFQTLLEDSNLSETMVVLL